MATTKKAEAAAAAEPEAPRAIVYLGNRNVIEVLADPDDAEAALAENRPVKTDRVPHTDGPKKRCTTVIIPADWTLLDAVNNLTHPTRGTWQQHSDDETPAWVASTWPELSTLLSAQWGGIEIREPDPAPVGEPPADTTAEA